MSSVLSQEETKAESDMVRGAREVTVTFPLSAESIDELAHGSLSERQFLNARMLLLACGLYSLLQELRDRRSAENHKVMGDDGNPIVPAVNRERDLKAAARHAAVAITNLETAMWWAREAAGRIG